MSAKASGVLLIGRWTLLLGFVAYCGFLIAQGTSPISSDKISGAPFIRNYSPQEYSAHNQNWAIVQDHRGVMYFANTDGVLEYDGVSWRLIPTPSKGLIRSLAIDESGRIYVGSSADFGYLAADTTQQLHYASLSHHVEDRFRDFADVWQTLVIGENIVFVTSKYLFRWNGTEMRTWTTNTSFHVGFEVNGQLFVRVPGEGLKQMIADSLVLVPRGEEFAGDRIMVILPFTSDGNQRLLLGSRSNGLLLYDGATIEPLTGPANDLLKAGQIYCGQRLTSGHYAFGTLQNGVVVIDANGRLIHHLHKAMGLQDETIWYVYPDRQGGLWIAMHVGISRAEVSSPHTHFTEREGVEGSVLDIVRNNDRLYIATSLGIYYLDESTDATRTPGRFRRVTGVSPQAWDLLPFGRSTLAATFDGVYQIHGDQGKLIHQDYVISLLRSRQDTNRVFIGLPNGLKSIYLSGNTWSDEGNIEGIDGEVFRMSETADHKLWVTARYEALLLVDFSNGRVAQPAIMRYDSSSGLPLRDMTFVFPSAKGPRFATTDGIYAFDQSNQKFYPDTTLVKGLPPHSLLFSTNEDHNGNIWMIAAGESGVALSAQDSTYVWHPSPFSRINDIDDYYAYPDPGDTNVIWIGLIDRVIRYDRSLAQDAINFPTLIRMVLVNGDSLLYGGAGIAPENSFSLTRAGKSLRFVFAAPSFDDVSRTQYQYILEGYDKQWSDWSTETYKDYTRLPPGTYYFRVRSKDLHQQYGETASVEFRSLPPFYLTWWAYVFYAIIAAALFYALWRLQLKELRRKHLRELKLVEFEKLKELDQLKSRFFANISHELRTPLTLILGPVDNLLATNPQPGDEKQFKTIKNNAERLLRLINQLLDLSKLEAGKMQLVLRNEDIVPLLKGSVHSFESLAQTKNIRLELVTGREHVFVNFDRDKMEQIFNNLVSNAIKFTPAGGEVQVHAKIAPVEGQLQIDIADTGPGIPAAQLPFVFDRFYQGEAASRIGEPGTGIGLALTKELVSLHQGSISVQSTEGKGSCFTLLFPCVTEFSDADAQQDKQVQDEQLPDVVQAEQIPPSEVGEVLDHDNTLLLVEDNHEMRVFIRENLVSTYTMLEAVDGQEGITKALEFIPDIIISDVMMPQKDGLQLCEALKNDERTSHIPIILLTAKADIESRLAGLERGADDYLAKPFHRDELLIRTRNLLKMRDRLRNRFASLQPRTPAEDKDIQVEDAFILKIRGIAEQHLSDSEFEVDKFARLVGMSRSQLFRKIKALTGLSPSLFIRSLRLHRAKELLETTVMNVSEVAYEVGFSTPAYFSDAFAETYGIRPSQFRK